MGLTNCNKNIDTNRLFLVLILIFSIYLSQLFYPGQLNAQQGVITYLNSITTDAKEANLSMPFFVKAEREMDEIYIIDTKGRIIIYTGDFFPLYTLSKKRGIEAPQGLDVDAKGNLYVAQASTKKNPRPRISVFSACLRWDRDIYISGFEGAQSFVPHRVAVDKEGNIYAAAGRYPGEIVLSNNGLFIDKVSPEENGRIARITNVSIDNNGQIYLVSEEESRIYVYDKNRNFLFKFGEKGGSSGKLSRPRAVGVDSQNGTIYVADYMRHTIAMYDNKGTYIHEFGGLGWNEGWFQHPIEIDVDAKGRILVADFFNQRIQIFTSR